MNEKDIAWLQQLEQDAIARRRASSASTSPRAYGYWDGQARAYALVLKRVGAAQ